MSYESAPTTKMLKIRCIICGRPLANADSVERAVGPDCAAKNGIETRLGVTDWDRAASYLAGYLPEGDPILALWADDESLTVIANALTWHLAQAGDAGFKAAACMALDALGYRNLAVAAAGGLDLLVSVDVTDKHGAKVIRVRSPYSEQFVRAGHQVPGRRWIGAERVTEFPYTQRTAVWGAIAAGYGRTAIVQTSKGLTRVADVRA